MLRWLIGIILGKIICKSSNWQHIQELKITILGANWQLFRLESIAKCSYFILSTQIIKFYWFKKFLLPIWWYNRGSFPLGNKYFGVFVLNGNLKAIVYCISCYFREGFIFANFASQTLAKISTSSHMSIYSNDNIRKIAKLSTRELPHLVQKHENNCTRK